MKPKLRQALLLVFAALAPLAGNAQDFTALSATPRDTSLQFPLDYKIVRPRPDYHFWDGDFNSYYRFLTPALKKTQMTMGGEQDGVTTAITPNSILPHAQLDTGTRLRNPALLEGTWRMLRYRSLRFNDSASRLTKSIHRLPDTLLADRSGDDAFAVISGGRIKMFAREAGRSRFKRVMAGSYQIESGRYMLMYKLLKAGGGVSQVGIDEKGYLIINYPRVVEMQTKDYISYYAVIEQYIFQKVE